MTRASSLPSESPLYIGPIKDTAVGDLWIAVTEQGLAAVEWVENEAAFGEFLVKRFKRPVKFDPHKTAEAAAEIRQYLEGKRREFSIPIDWSLLRPFQCQVLQLTFAIPYGETRTYGDIAAQMGKPRAARAVGRAQATNPMPLVIPCHRVVGRDGKLHGYGGGNGLPTKEWLLKMEGALIT
jgi:methylated-DNA-[protein]-cysteine S-methyltransferase